MDSSAQTPGVHGPVWDECTRPDIIIVNFFFLKGPWFVSSGSKNVHQTMRGQTEGSNPGHPSVAEASCIAAFLQAPIRAALLPFFRHPVRIPRWLSGKESTCNAGDMGLIPGSKRCPAEGNGNPLQYFCLQKSKDGEAWQATVDGVSKELDPT